MPLGSSREYFTFDGICSKDIDMFIINDSNGYMVSQYMPDAQNNFEITENVIIDKGRQYTEKIISLRVAVKTRNHYKLMKDIVRWLEGDTDELKPLILSSQPYKQYYARRTGELSPSFYPEYIVMTLQFIALDRLAYSIFKAHEINEFMFDDERFKDSGIRSDMKYSFTELGSKTNVEIYHGGNCDECYPKIVIKGQFTDLRITNRTTSESMTLAYNLNKGDELVVDCANKVIYVNGDYNVAGHYGDFISLKGKSGLFESIMKDGMDSGINEIEIYTPNKHNIEEILFDFRYVYY